jgi:hypothetical protein
MLEWCYRRLYWLYGKINYADRIIKCRYRKNGLCYNENDVSDCRICSNENEQECPANSGTKEYDFTHGRFRVKTYTRIEVNKYG